MRKSFITLGIALALLLTGVAGASTAQAAPKWPVAPVAPSTVTPFLSVPCRDLSWVKGCFYFGDSSSTTTYSGTFRDGSTPDGLCPRIERQTGIGDWVNTGWDQAASAGPISMTGPFHSVSVLDDCSATSWVGGLDGDYSHVFGLRFRAGSKTSALCDSYDECRALLKF